MKPSKPVFVSNSLFLSKLLKCKSIITAMVLVVTCITLLSACGGPLVLVVNSSSTSGDNNPGDGLCQSIENPDNCTLQAAIDEANTINNHVSIEIANVGQYFVSPTSEEGLLIEKTGFLTITGATSNPGATTIRPLPSPQTQRRVFTVRGSVLTLNNLTVRGGYFDLPPDNNRNGGGILVEPGLNGKAYFLTLNNCIVEENQAQRGGGIFAANASNSQVLIFDSVIRNNTAFENGVGGGGGLDSNAGYIGIANTQFEGNFGQQGGASIASLTVDSSIYGSTFYNNQGNYGGGLGFSDFDASLDIIRSTLSTNTALYNGGGIYTNNADIAMNHVTITENGASNAGRGIYVSADSQVAIYGTVIGGNYLGGGDDEIACGSDTLTSNGHNVLSNDIYGPCNFNPNLFSDQVGAPQSPGLADYLPYPIGHHPPHIIGAGLDAGENVLNGCEGFDQIGNPVPFDGDNDGFANCDAGAIELHLAQSPRQSDSRVEKSGRPVSRASWAEHLHKIKTDMLVDALQHAEIVQKEQVFEELGKYSGSFSSLILPIKAQMQTK